MNRILSIFLGFTTLLLFKVSTLLLGQVNISQPNNLGIIPLPLELTTSSGSYLLPENINISASSKDELTSAGFFKDFVEELGKKAIVGTDNKKANVFFVVKPTAKIPDEGYTLTVNKDGVKINASSGAGLFYGLQTLMQIFPSTASNNESIAIPYVTINDKPELKWRGAMLDVGRHFFPVSFVKKYIDLMAAYKLNTFHWHLTEDQGWRIEIKKYPKLTEISAFRDETIIGAQQQYKNKSDFKFDGTPYGGFYTQDEIRDVVAYAQERYVTIVPEIEMPGHSTAILAAYPELACKPGDYDVITSWGVYPDIVCPSEETFQFFENVLSEVVALFPGEYVHIGGDEAPKDRWKESSLVQDIIKKEGLDDVEKVQGWFNQRIEKFLNSKGKKLVGWDEILEGGITPGATVMSWRGEAGGIEAAKHGNTVVMSPTSHMYFDYGQHPVPHHADEPLMICCYLPIEKVYSYNPYPKELSPEQHKLILGVQANLWTEYISTPNKVEYMLFPRLLALSEVAWTPYKKKNFENFVERVSYQFPRLDAMDVNYRIPEPTGLDSTSVKIEGNKAIITLNTIVPNSEIRYTLDGKTPDETTSLYTEPLAIPTGRTITVKAVTINQKGRISVPATMIIP